MSKKSLVEFIQDKQIGVDHSVATHLNDFANKYGVPGADRDALWNEILSSSDEELFVEVAADYNPFDELSDEEKAIVVEHFKA